MMTNGGTTRLYTVEDIRKQEHDKEGCRRLRLTLHEQKQAAPTSQHQQHRDKPVGRAFALVQPANDGTLVTPEPIKAKEEQVEVIKVYLEARRQENQKQSQNLKMLSDEVSQIQEVRYCLKTLREQMASKSKMHTNGWKVTSPFKKQASSSQKGGDKSDGQEASEEAERTKLREVSKRLYAQLQDAEKKHQEEREKLQAEGSMLRERLSDQEEKLKSTEEAIEMKDQRIEELQRLLGGMEKESATLRETIRHHEEELCELRHIREEGPKGQQRAEQLEKEVAILKEKIHHLDDMLKSQQRKVRHMIEQLQNSRMVIQERDRVIKELEEKVAFLEAENREMHDQMDYFLGGSKNHSYLSSEHKPQIVYSKPIKPTTSSNKPLPFIKVIEIKS
ncbi:tuftelin 1a [Dunckerocampus dactyliophorus]|uniref:tuftelin 1a n=1 Tax=Dunckerocampus dactyliophorus TaxID=161453 RepID=UPI00240679C1|nr:tuftelin 1a [Dunckerocampus dactyliophorus]